MWFPVQDFPYLLLVGFVTIWTCLSFLIQVYLQNTFNPKRHPLEKRLSTFERELRMELCFSRRNIPWLKAMKHTLKNTKYSLTLSTYVNWNIHANLILFHCNSLQTLGGGGVESYKHMMFKFKWIIVSVAIYII